MILVDTNTWVRHVRSADLRLVHLLQSNRVVTSVVVIGELMLGAGLPATLVGLLNALPQLECPSAGETLAFIQRHASAFRSSGVGWADSQLIVSAVNAGALMHSSDGPMRATWRRLGFRLA